MRYINTSTDELWECHKTPSLRDEIFSWDRFRAWLNSRKIDHSPISRDPGEQRDIVYIASNRCVIDGDTWVCFNPVTRQIQFLSDYSFHKLYVLESKVPTIETIPTKQVAISAAGACPETLITLGYDNDGEEYFASSIGDNAVILWLLERFKQKLLSGEWLK